MYQSRSIKSTAAWSQPPWRRNSRCKYGNNAKNFLSYSFLALFPGLKTNSDWGTRHADFVSLQNWLDDCLSLSEDKTCPDSLWANAPGINIIIIIIIIIISKGNFLTYWDLNNISTSI